MLKPYLNRRLCFVEGSLSRRSELIDRHGKWRGAIPRHLLCRSVGCGGRMLCAPTGTVAAGAIPRRKLCRYTINISSASIPQTVDQPFFRIGLQHGSSLLKLQRTIVYYNLNENLLLQRVRTPQLPCRSGFPKGETGFALRRLTRTRRVRRLATFVRTKVAPSSSRLFIIVNVC